MSSDLQRSLDAWRASKPRWPAIPRETVLGQAVMAYIAAVGQLRAKYPDHSEQNIRRMAGCPRQRIDDELAACGWGPASEAEWQRVRSVMPSFETEALAKEIDR